VASNLCIVCESKDKLVPAMSQKAYVCATCFGAAHSGKCEGCKESVRSIVLSDPIGAGQANHTILVVDMSGRKHKCKGREE
jgi:hypothetical protein